MQLFNAFLLAGAALASLVVADNSATFVNQDSHERTVSFTPSAGGSNTLPDLKVPGNGQAKQQFPNNWIGNAHSASGGGQGILAEFRFNGFGKDNFFDISGIVDPDATDGVIMMYPSSSKTPVSGCKTHPCSNQYNQPDDKATQSSKESDFTVILGTRSGGGKSRRDNVVGREFLYM